MANTIYSTVQYFNTGLNEFGAYIPFMKAVSTEFIPEPINGASLRVPLYSATAEGGLFNGTYESSGSTLSEITVPLSHVFQSFDIKINESTVNAAARLEKLYAVNLQKFAQNVAKEVLKDVSSFTGFVSSASFGYDTVKSIASQLDQNNVSGDRYLLVDTTISSGLYVSSSMNTKVTVQDYDFVSAPKISTGILPSGVKGVALSAPCYAMANGLVTDELAGTNAYIDYTVITDPATGFTFAFKVFGLPNAGTKRGVFEALVGGKVGNNKGVKIS